MPALPYTWGVMADENKDPAAQALGKKRMDGLTARQRSKLGKEAAAARWAGHVAKRPASSRKHAAKKGRGK